MCDRNESWLLSLSTASHEGLVSVKSSEASFVKDVRETRLAVDDAPARQPAPALVSFRTRVPNVRSSVSQSSVAILSRWLDSVDFESTGD